MTLFNHPIHTLTHPLLPPKIEKSFYFQMYWVVPINCMNFAYIFQKKENNSRIKLYGHLYYTYQIMLKEKETDHIKQ